MSPRWSLFRLQLRSLLPDLFPGCGSRLVAVRRYHRNRQYWCGGWRSVVGQDRGQDGRQVTCHGARHQPGELHTQN